MNWFDILKNSGLTQRQRQGISARQKDEDFVFEDEDSTCRDKLIELYQKALNSFPDGKRTDEDQGDEEYNLNMVHKFAYEGGIVEVRFAIANEGVLPDDVYCRLLNTFEKIEKAGPGNGGSVGYDYIDYNLEEPKFVVGNSEIYYEGNEHFGVSDLGFYTYINDSPDLHPGHGISFNVSSSFKEKTIEEGFNVLADSPNLRYKTLRDFKNWRGLF